MLQSELEAPPYATRASRRAAIKLATLLMITVFGAESAISQTAATQLPVGTNLDQLNYWSPMLPMLDLSRSSEKWLPQTDTAWNTGEAIPLDANGWVIRLPRAGDGLSYTRAMLVLLHENPAAPPNTRYVVLYSGTGTFAGGGDTTVVSSQPGRLVIRSGASGALYLQLRATDPAGTGDYARDIRVVREDLLARFTAGESFFPPFVAKTVPFNTFRFMDWMNTNRVFNTTGQPLTTDAQIRGAPSLRWSHRAQVSHSRWGEDSRGVPVEKMVELANLTGTNPWFNMPINASDEYVKYFAIYVRDNLRPDLKVRVEFSNEVWNFAFPQSQYAQAKANAAWGAGANWMEWYGMRAAQVGRMWNAIFREPVVSTGDPGRVIVVYNTQFGWRGLETYGLETPNYRDKKTGAHIRAADYFDEYAITGYIAGTMDQESQVSTVMSWWRDADGGYSRAIAALRNQVPTHLAPGYVYHAAKARQYGLKMIAYESGYAETTPISQHQNQQYTDFLINVQRRPEMQEIYTANLNAFRNAGGTLFVNFGLIYRPGKWGSWGVLENVNQVTTPRYRALSEWSQTNNPPKTPR